jgi:hypothetical protein
MDRLRPEGGRVPRPEGLPNPGWPAAVGRLTNRAYSAHLNDSAQQAGSR